ncbi:MAG: hypothetical protein IT457_18180 [Planctomycetes bacterium]|nr:hypothetical protein [Planctomycetota bacterium]
MNRLRGIVVAIVLTASGIGAAFAVRAQFGGGSEEVATVSSLSPAERSAQLARTRLEGSLAALDRFVDEQRARCAQLADRAEEWRVLAEAYLERCLLRDTNKGMAVGRTTHTTLPDSHRVDLEAGLLAIDKAIALGDHDPDAHRIQSSILSLGATGWSEILRVRPRVEAALRAAEAIDAGHPRIVFARACEKLFAPNRFLGHDPAAAERMFLKTADALTLDERPLLLAAMCAWLQERRDDCIAMLERALSRNANNRYVREVLRRIRASEDDPFGRDVVD